MEPGTESTQETTEPRPFAEVREGYEIRRLGPEHLEWVQAIVAYTMSFDSPLWAEAEYEGGAAKRAYDMFGAIKKSSRDAIDSGLSYGVFMQNWRGEEKLSWPWADLETDYPTATAEELRNGMQFSLISIAMSKASTVEEMMSTAKPTAAGMMPTGAKPADTKKGVKKWGDILPHQATISKKLKEQEDKLLKVKSPFGTRPAGPAVKRSGTHTRPDHDNKGLSKALAHHLMREMEHTEYRWIRIHTNGEHVNRVWERPPGKYRAHITGVFETANHSEPGPEPEEECNPFGAVDVTCERIWIDLKPESSLGG
jgi:hypothetical protein